MYEIRQVFYHENEVESFPIGESPNGKNPDAWGVYKREPDGCIMHVEDYPTREAAEKALRDLSKKP